MTEMKNPLPGTDAGRSQSQSQVGFDVSRISEQIELECFSDGDRPLADRIALIIAEIYRLPPAAPVRIDGQHIPAGTVREIYARLDHENVEGVIARFREATYPIRHIKTYIRTALYNSVFEGEFALENAVRNALGY